MWNLWKSRKSAAESEMFGQLEELVGLMKDHEARLKGLETEWASVYSKLRKALGHITKTEALQKVDVPTNQEQNGRRRIDELTRDEIARLPLP